MREAVIIRDRSDDLGTFGRLHCKDFSCETLECPWRENRVGVSCIPKGRYRVEWSWSPKYRRNVYRVHDVPGRSGILIHPMNWAGDATRGYLCDVEGCIGLGAARDHVWNERAKRSQFGILRSRLTVREFENYMEHAPFWLTITGAG